MNRTFALVLSVGLAAASAAPAIELKLPDTAKQIAAEHSALDSYNLPTGPFTRGSVPYRAIEGQVERYSWRIEGGALTTLQVLQPLRDQLDWRGMSVIFECHDVMCGGFDFRFGIEVLNAPAMHVDIRDFRYLAATLGGNEAISVLVSRAQNSVYVQVIHVNRSEARGQVDAAAGQWRPRAPEPVDGLIPEAPRGLAGELTATGHVVLQDLSFQTGSSALSNGAFASLSELAAFMTANEGVRIALVGHTDSIGRLDRNIALSKRRAQSVRQRLIEAHGIAPGRIDAEGMGYLAPVASNLTEQGREANRRVEAILLSDG